MSVSSCTIIGAGRIGQLFASLQDKHPNIDIQLLRRGETDIAPTGPIIVCTRNDDLQDIVDRLPVERHADLIFIQNGMLHTWLAENNLQDSTQALLYIAVSKIGDPPVDGLRSVVTGRHSGFFCELMHALELHCTEVSREIFQTEMVEKFLWNCCFGLLSQHFSMSVGELLDVHHSLTEELIQEQLSVCEQSLNFSLSALEKEQLVERLCAYSRSIYDYRGAVKEWSWRNGWLVAQPSHPRGLHDTLLSQTVPHFYRQTSQC